jgi:hypothetical protein
MTTMQVGRFRVVRVDDDPCGRGRPKKGLGLAEQPLPKSQGTGSGPTYILVGYGNTNLQDWGNSTLARDQNGGVVRIPTGGTNEKIIQDDLVTAEKQLQANGARTLMLFNKTPAQISRAVAADRAANPGSYEKLPVVIEDGHGTLLPDAAGSHAIGATGANGQSYTYKTVDTLKAVGNGLGKDNQFCAISIGCMTGGVPGEIAADPQLSQQVVASVASSGKNEVSFSPPDGLEHSLGEILKGTDPTYAQANDPTPDGQYTLADYLQNDPQNTAVNLRVNQVYTQFPNGAKAWEPVKDYMQPPNPVASTSPQEVVKDPQLGVYEAVQSVTYEQNRQSGGDPSQVVLSSYDYMPNGLDAFAPDTPPVADPSASVPLAQPDPATTAGYGTQPAGGEIYADQ